MDGSFVWFGALGATAQTATSKYEHNKLYMSSGHSSMSKYDFMHAGSEMHKTRALILNAGLHFMMSVQTN